MTTATTPAGDMTYLLEDDGATVAVFVSEHHAELARLVADLLEREAETAWTVPGREWPQ